ncbi:MAG TPA: DUF1854 domain-containing protein [Isosphaeraceae bacterium]|jgi:hypothetical protein|nr:DUF1854 domain-containing protein [Isosphaeraceae bacterium]
METESNGKTSGQTDGVASPPCAASFGLNRDSWGRLVLIDADGRRHVGVEPIRGFPITDPEHWISVCDAEGRELVCVEALADLPTSVRQVLQEELAQREFVPVVRRIASVSTDSAPSDWHVETDRGSTLFTLNSDDDVRRFGPHGVLINDAQGLRYQIPDTRTLDQASRQILDRFL